MSLKETLIKRNRNNTYASMLGVDIVELEPGHARAVMPINNYHLNSHAAVHGGVLYTLADITSGNAAGTHGIWVATSGSDFHYLRAATDVRQVEAEAWELSCDEQFVVYHVVIRDDHGMELAVGTFTFAFLGRRIDGE